MTKIQWFDLDGTVWNTDAKWWIVDKSNPNNPIVKISIEEGYLLLNQFYIKDNLKIQYNGITAWLSKKIYDEIQSQKNISLENLGISFREFNDQKHISKQIESLKILTKNIEHLEDNDTISILTARGNKAAHIEIIRAFKEFLKKENIRVNFDKIYFVNDQKLGRHVGSTPEKKAKIIWEHIVGWKILGNKFISTPQEKYDFTAFYDDEEINIEWVINTPYHIKQILNATAKTNPTFANLIVENLNSRTITIQTNLITSNNKNPFKQSNIILNKYAKF